MKATLAVTLVLVALRSSQDTPAQLAKRFKEEDLLSTWVYQDLSAGFAQARRTGKPLLIVFR